MGAPAPWTRRLLLGAALAWSALAGAAAAFPMNPFLPAAPRAANGPIFWSIAETWGGWAPCLSARDESLGLRLAPYLDGGGVSAEIAGFQLEDQPPAAVEAFAALTSDLRRRIKAGKAAPAASPCRDVPCAMTALFGPDVAPRLLLLAMAYRFDASDLGAPADRPWTPGELDDMLAAFADLPAEWFPLDLKDFRLLLYRDAEAQARIGPAPDGAAELVAIAGDGFPGILVASGWRRLGQQERRATLVHEIAHEYARTHHWRGAWSRAMRDDRVMGRVSNTASSVSVYADESPDEDFAESVAAYRYMADLLEARAPARYAFLRDRVFHGLEYRSEAACGLRFPDGPVTVVADGR